MLSSVLSLVFICGRADRGFAGSDLDSLDRPTRHDPDKVAVEVSRPEPRLRSSDCSESKPAPAAMAAPALRLRRAGRADRRCRTCLRCSAPIASNRTALRFEPQFPLEPGLTLPGGLSARSTAGRRCGRRRSRPSSNLPPRQRGADHRGQPRLSERRRRCRRTCSSSTSTFPRP